MATEFYLRNAIGAILGKLLEMNALKGETRSIVENELNGDAMSDRFATLRAELCEAADGAPLYDDDTQERIEELVSCHAGTLAHAAMMAMRDGNVLFKQRLAAAVALHEQEARA